MFYFGKFYFFVLKEFFKNFGMWVDVGGIEKFLKFYKFQRVL